MPKDKLTPEFGFIIEKKETNNKILLVFIPQHTANIEPLKIEVTAEQWDALRFHFMTAVDDRAGITRLSYFKF